MTTTDQTSTPVPDTSEADASARLALEAANAAATGAPAPGAQEVGPTAPVVPGASSAEERASASLTPAPATPMPTLASEVQPEARKVDLLFREISASSKRLGVTPKALLAAVLTHAAHVALQLDYPASAALDEMIVMLATKKVLVGDRVRFTGNGATGKVESFQEKTGWAVVKWDHADASPADLSQLEKLGTV